MVDRVSACERKIIFFYEMDNPAYILENILPKSTFVFLFITLMKWIWPYIKEEY